MNRRQVFGVVVIASVAGAAGYAALRGQAAAGAFDKLVTPMSELPAAASRPYALFRSTALGEHYGRLSLEYLEGDRSERRVAPLQCDRVHFAAGRGICLEALRGVLTTYRASLFDRSLTITHTLPLAGPPSRARISPDGRFAAMTVFVAGHSYDNTDFTTRTSVIDAASGQTVVDDLEHLPVFDREGEPFKSTNFNFWGITFVRDTKRFYATLGSGMRRYLVEGDLAERRLQIVHDDVECPSLSPDHRHIAFKRRVGAGGRAGVVWRLWVLDLATGADTALDKESRNVDDQVEWLDDRTIVYALPADETTASAATNSWALGIDGATPPRLLLALAFSPAIVRP